MVPDQEYNITDEDLKNIERKGHKEATCIVVID
jgi:hypothetical protein